MLDRILSRQHPEGLGQEKRLIPYGDLPFLHRFQKRALDLGWGPVDLVGKQHAGDDRAGADVECACCGAVDLGARQVRGQEVGCELDAAER